jgi:phage terminase large subunit
MEIIYKPNENSLIPFGLDDVEKLKSITGITGTWGEEPTEIEEDEFKQVDLRMRGETKNYKQHIFSYNPINEDHWLKKKQDIINVVI